MILRLVFLLAQYLSTTSVFLFKIDFDHDSKKPICPSVCNVMACRMGILTCSEYGLTELPKSLPPNTKKILLINQDFSKSKTLSRYNFTEYTPPEHNITKITIQNCSLSEIMSASFVRLTHLETLDLSFNKLKELKPRTFAMLRLKFLRLDGNRDLQLSPLSFQDLHVTYLSLIDCQLTNISYSIFKSLRSSLERLMLSKNRIKTLDSNFEPLFRQLVLVGLEENNFDCSDCSLLWMLSTLKSKIAKHPDTQKVLFPRCQEPPRLRDRYIHELAVSEMECPKPSVHRISILILPNNSAALTCTASDFQSRVVWTQLFRRNDTMPLTNLLSEAVHSNNLLVDQDQPVDLFSCTVTSVLGNRSSTKLQISWPKLRSRPRSDDQDPKAPWRPHVTSQPKPYVPNNYFFQPQFSLIEMIAAVVGTFIFTLIVFIAMLRCVFYRMKIFTKSSQLRDHQLSLTDSKKEKRKHYSVYEPPVYSESQTYDIPTVSPHHSTHGHYIDYKTQRTLYDRNNK